LVEHWVGSLSHAIGKGIPRPRAESPIRPGAKTALVPGIAYTSSRGVTWVKAAPASVLFLSVQDLAEGQDVFPLTGDTWIEVTETTEALTRTTAEVFREDGHLRPNMEHFHRAICECEFLSKSLLRVDELHQLRAREGHREFARREATLEIAAVMDDGV